MIRGYALMYVLALGVGWLWLPTLLKQRRVSLSREERLTWLTWLMAGVLVGGRLGYVLLYEPVYFWHQPGEVWQLWRGGMSSHGGMVGVALVSWIFSRQTKKSWWRLLDVLAVPAAVGIALGRVGNYINGELYTSPGALSVVVVGNLIVAGICFWRLWRGEAKAGEIAGWFLLVYGLFRLMSEEVREPEWPRWGVGMVSLTRGQVYTLGLWLIALSVWARRRWWRSTSS
jgi:phosphatidylglycerol:prolipoprotein diacylglycerol transferase